LIDAGRLRRVLPDWNTPHLPIHAVYPTRRHLSAKVQAMASFLKDWFAAQ
jgi:DNA-binding transcriptional LysR family regulator